MVFQNTPGTEAPAEMNTWFPQFKAFWAAENMVSSLHNILTLRGAPVRDALAWSKYINQSMYKFGNDAEVMFAAHTWPHWGKERILQVMRGQRDMYANLNNQVLHLANSGRDDRPDPERLRAAEVAAATWFARGYHGSYQHNCARSVQRYLGFWDLNPATLDPLSPEDSAPLYVEMMGGDATRCWPRARSCTTRASTGWRRRSSTSWCSRRPATRRARLLADIFEQQGYQYESPSLRNSFLVGGARNFAMA